MPNVAAKHAASLKAVQKYWGDDCPTFRWANKTFKILPGSAILRKDLGVGGFSMDSDLAFVALTEDFADNVPALRQVITYQDHGYRIEAIHNAAGGKQLEFKCKDIDQSV